MPASQRDLSPRLLRLARAAESDADLLSKFVQTRDESAFAALVERHGPMVLGVCRRALVDVHAADDAFQATFLALARKADRLRNPGAVAAWLYGTAVRIARYARRSARRTGARERKAPRRLPADPLAEITGRELVAAVDEELARLPEPFRAPVVLCCIEGLSQDEAARRLGWSPGSVKGRLERGRERLRRKLMRRGIALSSALALWSASRVSTATPQLFPQTVRVAVGGIAPRAIDSLAKAAVCARPLALLSAAAVLVLAAGSIATLDGGDPPRPDPKPTNQVERVAMPPRVVDRFGDPLPDGAVLRLGTTRLRHADVCALAFTADKSLVSFGRDYELRTWDPATGRQIAERAFEKNKLYRNRAGYLSPDAKRLAIQRDDCMKVFDAAAGRELAAVTLTDTFEALARFSPDGTRLAVVDQQGKLQVCDVAANSCRELTSLGNSHTSDMVFSRDGKCLALSNFARGVVVWDVTTVRELIGFRPDGLIPVSVDFDATGDVLAILELKRPQNLQFVRISTGEAPKDWRAPKEFGDTEWTRLAFDGSTVLLGGRDGVRWFDPKTGKIDRTVNGPAPVRPTVSADGQLVAWGGRHFIRIWDAKSERVIAPTDVGEPTDEVHGVAVSPDGKWILSKGSDDGVIRLWQANGNLKGTIRSNRNGGRYPIFSPDGKYLYGTASDAIALVRWEFPSGTESARYTFAEPAADQVYVYDFNLSADGQRLCAITQTVHRQNAAVAGGPSSRETATATVWDTTKAKRLESRELAARSFFGYGAFSPNLRWYYFGAPLTSLAGGTDYRFEVPEKWRATQAAVSRDGRLVAQPMQEQLNDGNKYWTESRGLMVHEVATGKLVMTLPPERRGPIAFTPDSRGLVVTEPDAITRWDLLTQEPVVRHKAPGRFIGYYGNSFASSLAIAPDGLRAITGHVDSTALVWDIRVPGREQRTVSEREVATAWTDLAGNDAEKAYAAIWSLADAPAEAVPFLRARLRPAVEPTADKIGKLIGRLDAAAFADREAAEKELRDLGDTVVLALRARLKSGVSAEQKERIEKILVAATVPTLPPGERLRQVRTIVALEQAGTPEARELLGELARGAPGDRLTKEAASARERIR
jgi:RNA polymerase sigma factor (sigma-70 family)